MKNENLVRFITIIGLVVIGILARLIDHPANVSPIAAIALFSGAMFKDKRLAFGVPIAAMFLSDAIIGFHSLALVVYLSFAVCVLIGWLLLKKSSVRSIIMASLAASVVFFIVTNFAYWLLYYPNTLEGLIACFNAALPFFRNSLIGDLVYSGVLFGGFAIAEKYIEQLRPIRIK
jgi:hypothetical protein